MVNTFRDDLCPVLALAAVWNIFSPSKFYKFTNLRCLLATTLVCCKSTVTTVNVNFNIQ